MTTDQILSALQDEMERNGSLNSFTVTKSKSQKYKIEGSIPAGKDGTGDTIAKALKSYLDGLPTKPAS
jgi:hypothetical protein